MAQPLFASAYPSLQPIPYTPITDNLLAMEWDSTPELLTHLLHFPLDRQLLLAEAHQRSPNHNQIFYVDHPLFQPKLLLISSKMTDGTFVALITSAISQAEYRIYMRHVQQELERRYPSTPRPTVSTSSSPSTLQPRTRTTMDGLADTCRHQ